MACYQMNKKIICSTLMVQMDEGSKNKEFNDADAESSRSMSVAVSLFKKSMSSLVVFSYLILFLSQSYAMDRNKVVPFDGHEGIELGSSYSMPVKFSKNTVLPVEELDSSISVAGLLHQDIESDISNARGLDVKLVDGSPTDSRQSTIGSVQEKKVDEISIAEASFAKDKRKIHPAKIQESDVENQIKAKEDEKKDDNNILVGKSEKEDIQSGEKLTSVQDTNIKNDVSAYLKEVMRNDRNSRDLILLVGGVLLAGALSPEIYGDIHLWTLSFIVAFQMTYVGFEFTEINPSGIEFTNQLTIGQTAHMSIALAPYVLYRSLDFIKYLFPAREESSIKMRFGRSVESLGATTVLLASASTAGMVAFQLYAGEIQAYPEIAKPYTSFVFLFYMLDSYLRFTELKESVFNYLFIKQADATDFGTNNQIAGKREYIKTRLQKTKKELFEKYKDQSSGELLKFSKKIDAQTEQSQEQFNTLLEAGKSTITKPVDLSLVQSSRPKNIVSRTFAGTLALSAAYLAFYGTYNVFRQASQISFSDGIGTIGDQITYNFDVSQYNAWLHDTANIRQGNETNLDIPALENWCAKCFGSTKFSEGDILSGGVFGFEHCPGVSSKIKDFTSNPGDFDYPEMCAVWYDYIDGDFAGFAGIKNKNNYDDQVTPPYTFNIPPASEAFAVIGGISRAIGVAALTIKTVMEFSKRVKNSFTNKPDEIITGKHNIYVNSLLMPMAFVESLNRAVPSGMAAWISMQGTNTNQGLVWTLSSSTTVSSAFNVFPDFDTTYTTMIHDMYEWLLLPIYKYTWNKTYNINENTSLVYTKLIRKINRIISDVGSAKPEVIKELYDSIKWGSHKRGGVFELREKALLAHD